MNSAKCKCGRRWTLIDRNTHLFAQVIQFNRQLVKTHISSTNHSDPSKGLITSWEVKEISKSMGLVIGYRKVREGYLHREGFRITNIVNALLVVTSPRKNPIYVPAENYYIEAAH